MFVPERFGGFRNESVKIRVIPNWNHFKIRLVIDPKGQLKKWEKKPCISEQIKRPEGLFYFYLRGFHDLVSPNGMLHANFFQSCPTLCDPMDCSSTRLLCLWDSPEKNTGVGCHALLQGIFLNQGSNPLVQHCRQILEPLGKPLLMISLLKQQQLTQNTALH